VDGQLTRQWRDTETLPVELWRFAEAVKDVSALAITHRPSSVGTQQIVQQVDELLRETRATFRAGGAAALRGSLERHQLDFVGELDERRFGIAVIGAKHSRRLAESWAFRFIDLREVHADLRRIAVIDDVSGDWPQSARRVLGANTEAVVPSSNIRQVLTALAAA
jgi:hypothetical protein